MNKQLEGTIISNVMEQKVLNLLDTIQFDVHKTDIVGWTEYNDDEFGECILLVYKYLLKDDTFLEIMIEANRIIFLHLDRDDECVITEVVTSGGMLVEKLYN